MSNPGGGPAIGQKAGPKRFYRDVTVVPAEGGFGIGLDGRIARTPGRRPLVLPTQPLAAAAAAEWDAQATHVEPGTMPVTRIGVTAIDAVADRLAEVRAAVALYAGSDLLFHRAETPGSLVRRQEEAWGPVVDWAKERFGARFVLGAGIVPLQQPQPAIDAVAAALVPLAALPLTAVHTMTTLMGSLLLTLAVLEKRLAADEAWRAAHVDEEWQEEHWGAVDEAVVRRAFRWREMQAAALVLGETTGKV